MEGVAEEWNMAKAYLQRLDHLLTSCDYYRMNGHGNMWYETLVSLYTEMYPKLDQHHKKTASRILDHLTIAKKKAEVNKQPVPTHKFMDLELFLRERMEEKHMLTPKKEDTRGL